MRTCPGCGAKMTAIPVKAPTGRLTQVEGYECRECGQIVIDGDAQPMSAKDANSDQFLVVTVKRLEVAVPKGIDFNLLRGFLTAYNAVSFGPFELLIRPDALRDALASVEQDLAEPFTLRDFLSTVFENVGDSAEVFFRKQRRRR